jgi:MFS family permease
MYQVESSGALLEGRSELGARRKRVSRNVVLLGLTSLFTDISSEMVATILPVYVFFALGGTPLQFGIIDGIYQGASALVRVVGGFTADRWQRYKEVAGVGYGLSAACKLGLVAVGHSAAGLGAVILVDRTGKGLRTAPRDALISLSSSSAGLATAFGVHRALDTAGAMLGPLVAFGILLAAPLMFDAVFVVSFCFALIGLAILVLFVQNRAPAAPAEPARPVSLRATAGLLRERRFRVLMGVGAMLALTTMSDGFLYLGLQSRLDFDISLFPLLFVGTALAYMLLAVPVGLLADRVGRGRVFIGGYLLLLVVYTSLLLPSIEVPLLVVYLVLFGAYYAATDGVLMALASAVLPPELRASGLALIVTATSLARLVAAIAFGGLWTLFGVETAVLAFAGGLAVSAAVAALVLARTGEFASR